MTALPIVRIYTDAEGIDITYYEKPYYVVPADDLATEAFIVLREALRQVMDDFASDMAEDLGKLQLLPSLEPAAVRQVSSMISRQLFQQSLDYIEQVDRRPAICAEAQQQILMMFAGATVLQAVGELKLEE